MSKLNPLISIYIPCIKGYEKYLNCAIESVINQSYKNIHFEVILEGKNDEALKICKEYRDQKNFEFCSNKIPIGLQKLGNLFAQRAKGEFILRLDADDWLDKFGVEALVDAAIKNPEVGIVWGSYYYVSEDGNIIESSPFNNLIDNKDLPPHGAGTLIRKRNFIKVGGYNEELNAQDGYDIWSKIIRTSSSYTVPQIIFYYRQHKKSLSRNISRINKAKREIRENLSENLKGSYKPSIFVIGTIRDDSVYLNSSGDIFSLFRELNCLPWNITLCISSCSEKAYQEAKLLQKEIKNILVIKREFVESLAVPIKEILNSALEYSEKKKDINKFDIVGFINLHKKNLNIKYIKSSIHNLLTNNVDSVLGASINRDITLIKQSGSFKLLNKGRFEGVDLSHEQIFKWNEEYIFIWRDMLKKNNILGKVTCEIHDK